MFKKILQWFKQPAEGTPDLVTDREIRTLQLELAEREQEIARLTAEVQRQRQDANVRLETSLQTRDEQLLRTMAAPVAQLLTQGHLLEVEGKLVQARDVWAVARRMVRALEEHGLTFEEAVGERVPFDPDCHQVLGDEAPPRPGQMVAVRMVGVSYHGKILQKAGVDCREDV